MKRYKRLTTELTTGGFKHHTISIDNEMIEHPDGEWVKWEDVKDMHHDVHEPSCTRPSDIRIDSLTEIYEKRIQELKQEIKQLEATAELRNSNFYISGPIKEIKDIYVNGKKYMPASECNCIEMAAVMKDIWICPSHGYKRRQRRP